MKERPIIFSPEIVRAMLAGNVTQTRRVVKFMHETPKLIGQAAEHRNLNAVYTAREKGWVFWQTTRAGDGLAEFTKKAYATGLLCPYGEPGDRLWVKEAWYTSKKYDPLPPAKFPVEAKTIFRYLGSRAKPEWAGRTRSARFMPRWASRITLEIVNVRVERLQDISDNDALAECILITPEGIPITTPRKWYGIYWNRLNAKRGWPWESNSWVWVIEFKMLEPAEDDPSLSLGTSASNPIG